MPAKTLTELAGEGFRDRDKLVSAVTRHLAKTVVTDDYTVRGQLGIHPSEAAHSDWCPRATHYRLTGTKVDIVPRRLAMEMIYETGSDAGRKWQTWFREMGVLRGLWKCLSCELVWYDTSPMICPRCEVGADLIAYAEVPVSNAEHLLVGSADGDVLIGDPRLIEVKTIGAGSVRVEAPQLFAKYSGDWYKLWQNIHRPFASHLRQGMLYCFCADRKEIIYIYDPKFLTAYPKEFEIKFQFHLIEDILEKCVQVRTSLETGRPPKRPVWAKPKFATCQQCEFRSTCWNGREEDYDS